MKQDPWQRPIHNIHIYIHTDADDGGDENDSYSILIHTILILLMMMMVFDLFPLHTCTTKDLKDARGRQNACHLHASGPMNQGVLIKLRIPRPHPPQQPTSALNNP